MKLVKIQNIYISIIFLFYHVECIKVLRKNRDVIHDVDENKCGQLRNTVWERQGRTNKYICKCRRENKTFHIVGGVKGCFKRSQISPECKGKSYSTNGNIIERISSRNVCRYSLKYWKNNVSNWVKIKNLNKVRYKLKKIKGSLIKLTCLKKNKPNDATCFIYKTWNTYAYYTTSTLKESSNGNNNSIIIGCACAMVVIVVLIVIVLTMRWKKANRTPSNSTVKNPSCVDNNNQRSLQRNNYAADNYATTDLQMISHLQYKKGEKAKEEEIYKEIDKNGVFDEDYAQLSYRNRVQTSLQNDGLNEPLYFETEVEADTENELVSEPVYVETVPED